jgi:hypothetical protein
MKSILSVVSAAALLLAPAAADPHPPSRLVYQFPIPTWIETVLATRNGSLLATIIGRGELHLIDPWQNSTKIIHTFKDRNTGFGMAELKPNTYAVNIANFNQSSGLGKDCEVYFVDLNNNKTKVKLIASFPDAGLLNGMAALDAHTVLIADSHKASVVRLDVDSGKYKTIMTDNLTMGTSKNEGGTQNGINGVHIEGEYFYYSNGESGSINRVKIDEKGYKAGPYETIATNFTIPDDLSVLEDGTVYVARVFANTLEKLSVEGERSVVIGGLNSSAVAGASSIAFGRTWRDRNIAYVSTGGAQLRPVNGTYVENGKVVAVQIN